MQTRVSTHSAAGSARLSHSSRLPTVHVLGSSSNGALPFQPIPLDRPAGGASRQVNAGFISSANGYGLPSQSVDSLYRPSGGANRSPPASRFTVYSQQGSSGETPETTDPALLSRPGGRSGRDPNSSSSNQNLGSTDDPALLSRPGGRGGRDSALSSQDIPNTVDPALLSRPGGRGGRDSNLSSQDIPNTGDPAILSRPGGRGGRDASFGTPSEPPTPPVSIDRPGGRGGRGPPGGGDDGGSSGSSGGGGSGGGSGDSSSGGSGSDGSSEGFSAGQGFLYAVVYAGVCGAAYYLNKNFINKPAAAAVTKPCCAGKKK